MKANTFLGWLSAFLVGCRRCWIVVVPLFVLDAGDTVLAAKKTEFQALPELDGQISSQAYDVAGYPASDRAIVVGQALNAAGVSRAVVWESLPDGWMIQLLPCEINQSCWVMGVVPSPFDPNPRLRVVVGASQVDMVARPTLWQRDEPDAPWNMTVLPPFNLGLYDGAGEANAVGHPPTSDQSDVAGWAENVAGTPKAAVWRIGEGGVYEAIQLADLAFSKMSRANEFTYDATGRMVVVGWAVNGSQQRRPVYWLESPFFPPFDPPTVLSLCPGGTTGEVTGVSHRTEPFNEWSLVGWCDGPDINRQALLWITDDDGTNYTRFNLGVPAGFLTSEGLAAFENVGSHGFGHADAGAGAEAWMWSVNEKVTDYPVSEMVVNLPANVTLRNATAVGPFERIVGWFTTTLNGAPSRGAGNGQHAYVLTPIEEAIPTLSEWGVAVMTLLGLTAGTLLFRRKTSRVGSAHPTVPPPGA